VNPIRVLLRRDRSLGARGEDAAAGLMRRKGLRVVARNLDLGMGELDLVCERRSDGALVVVEVKTRQIDPGDPRSARPESNITSAKRAKLRALTTALMGQDRWRGRTVRIDVVAVLYEKGRRRPLELRHYESAV